MGRGGSPGNHPGMSSAHLKVFLADDSPAIRERVGTLLGASAMSVVGEGATPQACIDGILAAHPDVVVLDVQLEGGTGLQVLRAVRSADPTVAFVVFSNNCAPAYRRRYLGEGAACFLDKSTEAGHLTQAVAAAGHRRTCHYQ
jgi:DNA-binding NarL/FixJ family response regulator